MLPRSPQERGPKSGNPTNDTLPYIYIYIWRERERERQRERQRDRERDRETDRLRERERENLQVRVGEHRSACATRRRHLARADGGG